MARETLTIVLFACFAIGLPLFAMQHNNYDRDSVHGCTGDCYAAWVAESGGVVAIAEQQAEMRENASPVELGRVAYNGCIACHGAAGEGGLGPSLTGSTSADIAAMLLQYRNGETRGDQSSLMWSQASTLSDNDIDNLAAYIEGL